MFPDLSYFFHWLLGSEPDNWLAIFKTFGVFLVTAILVASFFLYSEMKRKEKEGLFKSKTVKVTQGEGSKLSDVISNAFFGFILGFKGLFAYNNFSDFKIDPASIVFSSKGNWIAGIILAIVFGIYKYWEKNKTKLDEPIVIDKEVFPSEHIGDITMIAAISGIIGAKLFAVIEDLPAFFSDPIGMFLSGSGLAIYGGLFGGFIGVFIYLKKNKIAPLHLMDAVAPALIIAYGVGRMGCQFSGDGDWGIVASAMPEGWFLPDWLWSFDYPHNVNKEGIPIDECKFIYCNKLESKVYPTPVYEIIMAFGIGAFLWAIRKRVKIAGMLFFIYVFLNGLERFFIEKIRVNIKYEAFGITYTQAEFIAVVLMIIGLIGILYLWKKGKVETKH